MELSWKREISVLLRNRGKKQPVGLRNASASCYINSVLQCLTYSPPLANYCLHRKHLSTCSKIQNREECPMCLLEDRIVRSLSEAQVDSEAPETITSNLKIFADYLSPNVQTDAQEFLDCVINACEECEKSNDSPETKILNKMFQLVEKRTRRCVGCGDSSHSDEIANYIPLPLSQPDGSFTEPGIVININESLSRYFSTEYLKDSPPCEKCKRISTICIEESISTPPNVLLLTLQRFWVDMNNFTNSKKMTNNVPFPESLQLTEYVTSPNPGEDYVYNLYAIIVHRGFRMSSGHYFAYVKDANNCWFKCNDSNVIPVTIQDVLNEQQNVYMLFYIRQTSPKDDQATCNNSERPRSPNYSFRTKCENSTNTASGSPAIISPEAISKPPNEALMKVLITIMCEKYSSHNASGSFAGIVPEATFKPENEVQGEDNMECSEEINTSCEKATFKPENEVQGEDNMECSEGINTSCEKATFKPENEVQGEDNMECSEEINTSCEKATFKPDNEVQGEDNMECSEEINTSCEKATFKPENEVQGEDNMECSEEINTSCENLTSTNNDILNSKRSRSPSPITNTTVQGYKRKISM